MRTFDVFSQDKRINLTPTERTKWLESLKQFLRKNPTAVGRALFGELGPWSEQDLRTIETLITSKVESRATISAFLSVLYEAARLWSVTTEQRLPLPHFLPPERQFDNPFQTDYATAISVCEQWKSKLAKSVNLLLKPNTGHAQRDLRMAAFLISAIVYGQVFGAPFLVGLIRAIPNWKRRTFAIGRIHIELTIARRGVADAEQRIWLPDALTATLWCRLQPDDAAELLAPVHRDGELVPVNDAAVLRRMGRLINGFRAGMDRKVLVGLEKLRQCARVVAIPECAPTLVAYNNNAFPSESLRRNDVGRLFPGQTQLEFNETVGTENRQLEEDSTGQSEGGSEPAWLSQLVGNADPKSVRKHLAEVAADKSVPAGLRLVADFAIALSDCSFRPGKRMSAWKSAEKATLLAQSLGRDLDQKDLSLLDPLSRRAVYLSAINRQPIRIRRSVLEIVRHFDLYLVAKNPEAFPVPRNSLPWLPKDAAVDPNLITHREYLAILDQIDAQWHARRGERRKTIARLLVMLAFKAGLRRGELRGLRVANLLVLGRPMLRIFHRKEDPLKTPNAERTLPIHALLTESELKEILDWRHRRIEEGARLTDYLFSFTKKSGRIPNFFFDRLNGFLRANTRYANAGEGIHLHHCRHAFGTWLFAALLKSDQSTDSIFPDLPETQAWLRNGKVLSQQLYRSHGAPPSRKHPFLVASLCGHASFDTTAGTYINIFPWLMAHALDQAEDLAPDPGLVRKASGVHRKTSRKWLGKGDVNNIPLQRLRGKGATSNATRIEQTATFKGRQDWRIPIWKMLVSRGHGEIGQAVTPEMEAIFKRADWLKAVEPRHPLMELSDGPVSSTIAAPLRPCSYDEVSGSKFPDLVSECYAESGGKDDRKLLYKAAGIFAKHYMRNGFVRFESISDIEAADLYVEFLRRLGFGKRELELVSGDMDQQCGSLKEWRDRLSEPYLLISPCDPKRNFYPKSSLWIRPKVDALAKRNSSAADFRFTMAMAFVAFGPVLETPARLRAVQTPSSHRPYHSSQ